MTLSKVIQISFSTIVFVACTVATAYQVAMAAPATTTTTAATASATTKAEQFQVGSMYVEKYTNPNAKGAPVILIPGLSSGGYVWDDTVKHLQKEHELYVITLAGFNGKPAMAGPKMAKAKESLLTLIQTQKIHKPVLVGHSLGSALSIWFAQSHSDLIRGVFGVDGLPVFPRSENMNQDQRNAMADNLRVQMGSADQKTYAQQQVQYMRTMGVVDVQLADKIAALSAQSDPAASAEYMADLFRLDLRKDLPAIGVPLAMVSPYYAPDFAASNLTAEAKHAYYEGLMKGTPKLRMVPIAGARHFPMYDQAQVFQEKLAEFINSL
ncbi:alpha/beta fold hydrolase [Undibacterium baiyunense]|uniref:Alpha/beta hydrolase n=1 Tax=Undibacterium baiyunense TaxID=2828731 RepID=A0A941DDF8_9BURK|nr:alpha/beta hydrolase [Undibacterium baiyunense]MBR7745623.1 alpha/beta hydrolase [Undibacterium baiyunense]